MSLRIVVKWRKVGQMRSSMEVSVGKPVRWIDAPGVLTCNGKVRQRYSIWWIEQGR